MLTLQLSSSFRIEQYPLSAKANSTVFSISTGLYLFRPVMYSGMFFRYLLKSIPSMNRLNASTGSDIEKNLKEIPIFVPLSGSKSFFSCRGRFFHAPLFSAGNQSISTPACEPPFFEAPLISHNHTRQDRCALNPLLLVHLLCHAGKQKTFPICPWK